MLLLLFLAKTCFAATLQRMDLPESEYPGLLDISLLKALALLLFHLFLSLSLSFSKILASPWFSLSLLKILPCPDFNFHLYFHCHLHFWKYWLHPDFHIHFSRFTFQFSLSHLTFTFTQASSWCKVGCATMAHGLAISMTRMWRSKEKK